MAAGDIFNARLAVTSTRATLDALASTGAKTYSYVCLRRVDGSAVIGNASVTSGNGLAFTELFLGSGTIIGANINLIGPATVEFFGITSA